MSYRIEYTPHRNKDYPTERRKPMTPIVFTFLGCVILLFVAFGMEVTPLASKWFSFLDELAVQLGTGTKIGQAVVAYCDAMLENIVVG